MSRNLENYTEGDDVRELQEVLQQLGYEEVGPLDGKFGDKTESAVRHFQGDNGLRVDGIVGPITTAKLQEFVGSYGPPPVPGEVRQPNLDPLWEDPNAPWHENDEPNPGYVRVYMDKDLHYDIPQADFDAQYVDNNIDRIAIQPDWIELKNIDSQTLKIDYANGLHYETVLGNIVDRGRMGDVWRYEDSLIVPATANDLLTTLNAYQTPNLYLIRRWIHVKIEERSEERLKMAELVAAFASIIAMNSQLDGIQ